MNFFKSKGFNLILGTLNGLLSPILLVPYAMVFIYPLKHVFNYHISYKIALAVLLENMFDDSNRL